ncbi:MAG: pilus assembly protein PilM [bacterium]|nr:pilus assembly protein PilM [bacterium]
MQLFKSSSYASSGAQKLSRSLARWFPTPAMVYPQAAGIDISDGSIKWLVLEPYKSRYRIASYGEMPVETGVVVNGTIQDVEALGRSLREVKKQLGGVACAHAALPEEAAYVFEMHVPDGTAHDQTISMIEFAFEGRVPITPGAAVYDFDVIQKHDESEGEDIGVAVFSRELAEAYVAAFDAAGIQLLSLEVEARSIARTISSGVVDEPVTLLVDFGRARTGFAVLKLGIPIFTSTVEVGGEGITKTVAEQLSLSPEETQKFKNEQGLFPDADAKPEGMEALVGTASALADEVARHYHYWDTRRNEKGERMTPVGRVVLVGGSANLKGLPDYLAGRVQAPTSVADVWRRVCNFDEYVPPVDSRDSLQYATAAGLALRSFSV